MYDILLLAFTLTLCFSTYKLVDALVSAKREKSSFTELSALVAENRGTPAARPSQPPENNLDGEREQVSADNESSPVQTDPPEPTATPVPVPLPQYAPLYELNPDFFGWLTIEGADIDYPVMYTPDRPEYYLERAFDGSFSYSGVPFIDEKCPAEGNFYLIYGHHMQNKTMFGHLPQYADPGFYEEHPVICFDTLYEEREYQVIAAFYSRIYNKEEAGVFRYYEYTDLTDETVFNEYIEQVRAAAIYDTGFSAEYGDELLTLSTCNYHTADGRFVVVAKRIGEAE